MISPGSYFYNKYKMDRGVVKHLVSYIPCDHFLVTALIGRQLLRELYKIDYFRRTCVTRLGKNLWFWFRFGKGILPRHSYWTSAAVRQGDLELLKALKLDSQPWSHNVNVVAITTGNIELLRWMRSTEAGDLDDPFDRPAKWSVYFEFEAALREGDIDILDWLWDNGCPLPHFAFGEAARSKKDPLRVVQWLWEKSKTPRDVDLPDRHGESPLDLTLGSYGYAGNVEIMKWALCLKDTRAVITTRDVLRAAEYRYLDTLKWLYGQEEYHKLVTDAIEAGNLIRVALIFAEEITVREIEFVGWLLDHGCKVDQHDVYYVISTGSVELVQFLRQRCPYVDAMEWNSSVYETLIDHEALDVIKLVRSFRNAPPYPSGQMKLLSSPSVESIKWLRQDGLQWQPDFFRLRYGSEIDLAKLAWLRSVSQSHPQEGDPWGRPCPWNPKLYGDIIRQYQHLRLERVLEYIKWLRKPVCGGGDGDGDILLPDPCPWPVIFTEKTLRDFDHVPHALIDALTSLGYVISSEEQTRINNFKPV
jgi:hypothetical protein